MKTKKILVLAMMLMAPCLVQMLHAQTDENYYLNTLRLETRFDARHLSSDDGTPCQYGLQGQYFNLHMGGNLGNKVSYYFRQRVIANPGSSKFFDNTDFLWVNIKANDNWRFRLGKDALAVGGFEYDAAPIDVYYNGIYWDNFYCFQLQALAAYTTNDGKNTFTAQVGNSPYVNSLGMGALDGMLSYNLMWAGNYDHVKTLWSVNLFENQPGDPDLLYIGLGTKLAYEKWDWYLDLINWSMGDFYVGEDMAVISRFCYHLNGEWNLFAKGLYEQSTSSNAYSLSTGMLTGFNCLFGPQMKHCLYGAGFEYNPKWAKDLRLHGFVGQRQTELLEVAEEIPGTNAHYLYQEAGVTNQLEVNVGLTWNINCLRTLDRYLPKH